MRTEKQKENIRTWIKALRSGEYEQGKGRLRGAGSRFCCLGVACEIGLAEPEDFYLPTKESMQASMGLPHLPWVSVDNIPSDFYEADEEITVANLNDNGATFDEIADAIEKEFL